MADSTQLTRALADHAIWKRRLHDAVVHGTNIATPEQLRLDTECELGRWLVRADDATRGDPYFERVREAHLAFHAAAADVLRLAQEGRIDDALRAMTRGGAFARESSSIVRVLMTWFRALEA